ncbi:MAG: HupE/UreJ family protein [Alphaproteobacteria bacterium]|nr:HupE/UreJ family protein [Alphaproteobacteria bacterium]
MKNKIFNDFTALGKSLIFAAIMLTAFFISPLTTSVKAHDIPASVTVHMYVKPEGNTLKLLLRVPLESMSELVYPTFGPGYLDFEKADPVLLDAAHVYLTDELQVFENGELINDKMITAYRATYPQDRSISTWEAAIENIKKPPLTNETKLYYGQAVLDVLYEFPIKSEHSRFSIEPTLNKLANVTNTVLRFLPPDSGERVFNYIGNPGVVELDPSLFHALYEFLKLGFFHILEGTDHILFLLCLIIPVRNFMGLVPVITSFTVAHSITLISTAFGLAPQALWFAPLIETLIALSIVFMAFENIVGAKLENRWIVAFAFGLVHGFGFSFLLSESMQFAGTHLFTSLLSFNLGVEVGQLFILIIVLPLLNLLFKYVVNEKAGTILLSALVAHSGWHWMTERNDNLMQYIFVMPKFDRAFYVDLMRWGMLLVIIAIASWAMYELKKYIEKKAELKKASN